MPEPLIGLHSTKQTNRSSQTGCGTRAESRMAKHRQTQLEEVHYEITVGMPSGLSPPPGLGIITRRTGCGRYVLLRNSSRIPVNHVSNPVNSISSKLCPSTPGAPLLARASLYAWHKMSSRYTLSYSR